MGRVASLFMLKLRENKGVDQVRVIAQLTGAITFAQQIVQLFY